MIPKEKRILSLDVLRGVAILGILPANLPHFALPMAADRLPGFAGSDQWESLAFAFTELLIDRKFVTIFSLLFGVGLALQHDKARAEKRPFFAYYLRRLFLLGLIGLAHGLGMWFGDILLFYALTGFVALLLIGLGARALLAIGLGLNAFMIGGLLLFSLLLMGSQAAMPDEAQNMTAALQDFAKDPRPFAEILTVEPAVEAEAYGRGPWPLAFDARLTTWAAITISELVYFSWRTLGLFLIGAALLRFGFFSDGKGKRRLWLITLASGLAIGLACEAPWMLWELRGEARSAGDELLYDALHNLGSLALALAYISAVLLLPRAWMGGRGLLLPLRCIGRAALSCYLGSTLLASLIFYHYGLGLYGRLDRAEVLALAGLISAFLALTATAWLSVFAMGPVEWAWRSGASLRLQPLLKRGLEERGSGPSTP